MPLQDVSNDPNMLGWLQTAGHGHLLADRFRSTSPTYGGDHHLDGPMRSSSSHVQNSSFGSPVNFQSSSFHQPSYGHSPPPPNFQSSSFHQPSYGHSPPPPNFQSSSFHQSSYGNSPPPILPRPQGSYGGITSNSPLRFLSSPLNYNSGTQFLAPNTHQQQLDVDIEAMRRDPNTRVVQRPPGEDVVYKQRVFVRYLQPPTPPVGGTIIVREKQAPPPPPDPPIVLRRAPPPPPTPPPVIIRERPPPVPPPEGTTIIDKIIPSFQKPPRQVIVEQYPPLPPKPQDVIIERWLPVPPRHRKILYERLPHSLPPQAAAPIIIQHGQPNVRVVKEVITNAPHNQLVPHVAHTDINHILSGLGVQQYQTAGSSLLSPSSLVCYSPYSTMQPTIGYSTSHQPQSNVIVLQGGAQHMLPSSSYAAPMTCVVNNPNILSTGLGSYGGGISTFPMTGTLPGQSIVCHVPDNVPVDSVLRQLGIDPVALQRSSYYSPHADPHSAVQHAWNAALHATAPGSEAVRHAWDNIEHYLHPSQGGSPAVRSAWDHITHPEHYPHPSQGGSSVVRSAWDHITHPEHYPHPSQGGSSVVRSAWDHITHPEHYPHPSQGGSSVVRSAWDHITHPEHYRQQSPPYYPPPSNYPSYNQSPPPQNYPPPYNQGPLPPRQGGSSIASIFGKLAGR